MFLDKTGESGAVNAAGAEMPAATTREKKRALSVENRIAEQPGFVLHSHMYRESSLVVEVFTRDYGRVALVAKGAKRPTSRLRGILQTFQPLSIGWSGKSELRTLTAAEWVGGMIPLENSALLYGFYLNELLLRLLAREPASGAFRALCLCPDTSFDIRIGTDGVACVRAGAVA